MIRRLLVVAGLCAATTAPLAAQVPVLDFRAGVQALSPTGDFADAFDSGIGLYGRVGLPTPIKLMAAVTWNRFGDAAGDDDVDFFTIQAGPHFSLVPLVDIGIEAAYLTEVEEMGLSPSISIGFSMLELTASYVTTFGDAPAKWLTVGLGIRF